MFKLGIGKIQTREVERIDMSYLKKLGLLKNNYHLSTNISWNSDFGKKSNINIDICLRNNYNSFIHFDYFVDRINVDYKMNITSIKCNYGGVRYWFVCNCFRNTRILYLNHSNGKFCCRKCADVIYESQSICYNGKFWSKLNRINYLESKIGKMTENKAIYGSYNNKKTKSLKRIEKLENKLSLLYETTDYLNCKSL